MYSISSTWPRHPGTRTQARRAGIVAAANAGDVHTQWETAFPCRRWPANRRCPGRINVVRTQPDHPFGWRCSHCGDDGTISNWAGSIDDLRRTGLKVAQPPRVIVLDADSAAILRTLPFLDIDCQRAVFAIRAHDDTLRLALTDTTDQPR